MTQLAKKEITSKQMDHNEKVNEEFESFGPIVINYDPYGDPIEQKVMKLYEVTIELLIRYIRDLEENNTTFDEVLIRKIADRFVLLGQSQILANFDGWVEEADNDPLETEGEIFQRFAIGSCVLFDVQKLGTGTVTDNEKFLFKFLTKGDWSVRKLARVFRRSESTIMKYKR